MRIEEFIGWYCSEPRLAFNRTVVLRYRFFLEQRNLAPATINVRLAAVRRLAYEASDTGLLSPDLAAGIRRVKGAKRLGVRIGNWLSVDEAKALLRHSPTEGLRGKRDRAILAVLIGCGLRRAELVGLRVEDFQIREEHCVIADLIGKGKHIRTVPVPAWVKQTVDAWTAAAEISAGTIFRRVSRLGQLWGDDLTPKAIWHVVKAAAQRTGIKNLAPHDLRRYAESRIMPNRQPCGHARKGLDTALCGIVLTVPVLRAARRTRSDWTPPFQNDRARIMKPRRAATVAVWAEPCRQRPTI